MVACTIAVVVSCAVPTIAIAEDDLPTRVGRVSDFAGALYLASDSAGDWTPIGQNYPVTASDRLWVAPEGRAEVDFGSSQMRLAGNTNVQVAALDEHRFALFVVSGRIIVRLRTLDADDSAIIDTPQTQVRLDRPGSYRIEVDPDRQETGLAVREGEADMRFEAGTQQVLPGQTATFVANDASRVSVVDGVGADGFDAWSMARDRTYDRFRTAYVAREMVGAVDLEAYGTWENYATYGSVWFPTVIAVGWAPYRFGHWVWCGPWGWTWVDDAPWGYAPFHYGRWVYVSGRWGWCPGAFSHHPVWAPALVAWFGGAGWTFSVGGGAPIFGWVPLAWGEPFMPHWHCSERCWRGLNQPVAADGAERGARRRFANSDVPGAVSAVSANVMTDSRPVAFHLVRVSQASFAAAPVLDGGPSIRPHPVSLARRPAGVPAIGAILDRGHTSVGRVAAPVPSGAPPRTYGGVPDGRGAYTGVAPSPGPKLPAKPDAGYAMAPAVRPPLEPLRRAIPAPAIAPVPAVVTPVVVAPAPGLQPAPGNPAPGALPPR
jgi:hypothetical protein